MCEFSRYYISTYISHAHTHNHGKRRSVFFLKKGARVGAQQIKLFAFERCDLKKRIPSSWESIFGHGGGTGGSLIGRHTSITHAGSEHCVKCEKQVLGRQKKKGEK